MIILSPEKQLKNKIENLETVIFDLQKLSISIQDELTEAKAFYFFRGHLIETLILKKSAVDKAIIELNEFQKLINLIK